jgi:hypothetical protein
MKINTQDMPDTTSARVWLDGVEITGVDYCFEADDEAGYIKCNPRIEIEPGKFRLDWDTLERDPDARIVRYGKVVIQLPEATLS